MPRRIDATKQLQAFDESRLLARRGDPTGVHDVRVCARRLRIWARFAGEDTLADELAWLCLELGVLRDLDVVDEVLTDEARALLRPPALRQAVAALDSARCKAMRERLGSLKAPRRKKARRVLERLERKLDGRRVKLDDESLHSLRRVVREVRHAREWLELDVSEHKHAQQWLGALNDLSTLLTLGHR